MATQIQPKPNVGIFPGEDGRPIPDQAIVRNPPTINPPKKPDYIGIPPGETGPIQKPITSVPTGIINANPAPTSGAVETTPVTPTTWNVTDPQTVQGQIKGIIAQDNPLQQITRTAALQGQAQGGRLNSSMSDNAVADAIIRNALPIAAQDAQTQAAAAQTNTTEANKMGMFGAELGSKDQQFNISEQNKLLMQNLDNENKVKLADINTSYQTLVEQNKGAAQLYDTYQKAINVILTNPDLSPESKQVAIDTQIGMLRAGMAMYSEVDGLNLENILDFSGDAGITDSGGGNSISAGAAPITGEIQSQQAAARLAAKQAEWDAKRKRISPIMPGSVGGDFGGPNPYYQQQIDALGPRPS